MPNEQPESQSDVEAAARVQKFLAEYATMIGVDQETVYTIQAGSEREASITIADLRTLSALPRDPQGLVEALRRSTEGWQNAVELGLIPERHRNTAQILADAGRKALAAWEAGK
jgi:hypothetical protein